jgi:hypothetical protein
MKRNEKKNLAHLSYELPLGEEEENKKIIVAI